MAKQLNSYEVKLDFKADTSQAKKEIQSLQQNLSDAIMKAGTANVGQGLSKQLSGAIAAASQLKIQLQEAFNVDTGRLDLGRFKQSMDQSGMSLRKYQEQLSMLGPEGEQAFRQLASSVVQAEVPLKRSNALLTEFATTLKNTARWQISSSLLHGFMGAIQSAYGYAQDLNESLNNIRIVTGYSTDKMAEFAANANKAAQALSTTTTAYTDAALIYYQQGLGDEEVLGRTDVTVKMANVSRQSAEEVSDQLTAIWNNFYDGSKSLEYYADVITALGAATASSSEEISTGLEKFAAVADTVGLSYEYATAALATITATTRQSAETVGTGLRTLFARLEGLKLGETLEDGVDLNKYSKALETVGVQILDVNGEIKDMDTILDETAAKWDTLSKAQQVAFAQTVGGVRQYTNLIALMDNWDFMQSNLGVAGGAEGTLDKQAKIYADSWEAAQKRVKAAAEDIYSALLDDKFFISLNNALADLLKNIKVFINGIGGVKGVILSLGAIFTTIFQKDIANSIDNTIYRFKMLTKAGQESIRQQKEEANQLLTASYRGKTDIVSQNMLPAVGEQVKLQETYLKYADKLTEAQRKQASSLMDQQQILIKNIELRAKEVQELEKENKILERQVANSIRNNTSNKQYSKDFSNLATRANTLGKVDNLTNRLGTIDVKDLSSLEQLQSIMKKTTVTANDFNSAYGIGAMTAFNKFKAALDTKDIEKAQAALTDLFGKVGDVSTDSRVQQAANKLKEKLVDAFDTDEAYEKFCNALDKVIEKEYEAGEKAEGLAEEQSKLANFTKQVGQSFAELAANNTTLTQSMSSLASTFLSVGSALRMITGLFKTLSDDSLSAGEKVGQVLTTLAMITLTLTRVQWKEVAAHAARIGSLIAETAFRIVLTKEIGAEAAAQATLNVTMQEGLLVFAATATAILAVIAAIGAIIFIIKKLVDVYHQAQAAQQEEFEAAKKQGEELKSTYEELTSKANEFKDAVSDYEDGVKALEELDKKSKEYGETLDANNEKARQLIENYGLFDKYYYENGQIKFKEGALDEVQAQLDSNARQANNQYLSNQVYTTQLQNNIDSKNIIKESGTSEEVFNSYLDSYKKAYEAGARNADEFKTYLNQHADIYGDLANSTFLNLGEKTDQLVNALQKYYETIDKNSNALDHYTRELLKNKIAEDHPELRDKATTNGEFDAQKYESYLNAYATINADKVSSDQAKIVSGVTASNFSGKLATLGNAEDIKELFGLDVGQHISKQDIAATYAAQRFGGNAEDYTWNKKANSVTNANGEAVLTDIDIDTIAQNLARMVSAGLITSIENYDSFGDWEQVFEAADAADLGFDLTQVLLDSIAKGEFDLSTIINQLSETQVESLDGETLKNLLGLTDEQLKQIGFESAEEFVQAVDEQLGEYDVEAYRNNINAKYESIAEDLDLDIEAYKKYRDILAETRPELAKNVELLNKVAIADKRVERGAKSLVDNWEEYNDVIQMVNETQDGMFVYAQDLSNILPDIQNALADIANVDISDIQELGESFITDNWDLITDSINGSATALDDLQAKIAGMTLNNWLIDIGVNDQEVFDRLNSLHEEIASFNDFPIEVPIDNTEFIAKCNEMIQAAGMTQEMAEEYFSKMGFDTTYKTEKKIVHEQVADLEYTYDFDDEGNPTYRHVKSHLRDEPHEIDVPAIETITPNKSYGGNIKSLSGGGGGKSGGGGGGGGKKTNPAENQKVTSKSDAGIERYKEIDDAINDLAKDQERLNKVTDAYYGANKVAYMKQQLSLLQKEVDLHKERFKWAQNYYNEDKAELDNFAKNQLGIEMIYDEDGSIKNYTSTMNDLFAQRQKAEAYWADASHFGSKEEQDEYKKNNVDPIVDSMNTFQKLVDQVDESNEERKKEMEESIQLMIEYKQMEYEVWQEGWKNQQDILEDQVKFLDHAKKLLGDSAVEMGEALALTFGGDNNYLKNTTEQLELYKTKEEELHQLLAENKITEADYVAGLEEIRDQYLSLTENLKELDDFMMEYYGKVLDKVIDEVKEYTDAMKQLNEQLSAYQRVMKLTGQSMDYDGLDKLLNAQLDILTDQYKTDEETYKLLLEQKEEMTAMYNDAVARKDKAAIELYEKQLKELEEKIRDTETTMLNEYADMMEKAEEIRQNSVDKAMSEYESMMTNGMGFDYLNRVIEHTSQVQDEYLTKTNQMFETTKMLRKIQTDMDSTSNRAAKERLNNFRKEIEDLKSREKMTKADLELAQKRYDLLVAEIALEEAKEAKTTVRLQRDNEGNYGYVYTADEGNIAQAQDDYFQAENDLYNTRLEITNEYGQKILELSHQQADELQALWEEYHAKGMLDSEEYQQKRAEILDHYQELMMTYTHNYAAAQDDDARVVADAWVNNAQASSGIMIKDMVKVSSNWETVQKDMAGDTNTWSTTTNRLIGNVETAERNFEKTSDWVRGQMESHFGKIDTAAENTKQKSQELAQEIRDDLRHEYRDLFSEVDAIYKKYGEERRAVQNNITEYGKLATKLQTVIDKYRTLTTVSNIKTYNDSGNAKENEKKATVQQNAQQTSGGNVNTGGTQQQSSYTGKQEEQKTTISPEASSYMSSTELSNFRFYARGGSCTLTQLKSARSGVSKCPKLFKDDGKSYNKQSLLATLDTLIKNKEAQSIVTTVANAVQTANSTPVAKHKGGEKKISSKASGGYTGEWSDGSGKLAILHSNEIVLNSHDTDNMFGIIDMVREITNKIDLNAAGLAGGYGSISSGGVNAGPQTLEQNVQINASFPNATNHSEIEEAFNNLINKASQYASRR